MAKVSDRDLIYHSWKSAQHRCNNPKNLEYKNYGGRGIQVCPEWNSFENFYQWSLSNGWRNGLSLDRIDNNGNYSPDNCRWTDSTTQANNRRNNVYIVVDGVKKTQSQWSREIGVNRGTIAHWIHEFGFDGAASRIKMVLDGEYTTNNDVAGIFVYSPEDRCCFESINQASAYYHITNKTISKYIDTGVSVKGHSFYSTKAIHGCQDGQFVCVPYREAPVNKASLKTRYLTVNGITKQAKEWSKDIGASERLVSTWIMKYGEEKARDKVAEALENGFNDKYAAEKRKPVLHIPTGEVYPSLTDTCIAFNMPSSTLRSKIKRHDEFEYFMS